MTVFDKNILDQMISFGFKFHKYTTTEIGTRNEYKYYPTYLDGKHYTLILYDYHFYDRVDHRLYICNNSDEFIVDTLYLISNSKQSEQDYIEININRIFDIEIRIQTINGIMK